MASDIQRRERIAAENRAKLRAMFLEQAKARFEEEQKYADDPQMLRTLRGISGPRITSITVLQKPE